MFLNTIVPPAGSTQKRKRIGRGESSGMGKTSTRGTKGAGSRKSSKKGRLAILEGNNFQLWRSIPKRGFSSPNVKDTQVVNLNKLETLQVAEVTPAVLVDAGMIKTAKKPVKVLAFGQITKAMTVRVHAASAKAIEAIEKAGGKVEIITE
jgi:large subunit ribosomal protein L15